MKLNHGRFILAIAFMSLAGSYMRAWATAASANNHLSQSSESHSFRSYFMAKRVK